jgi:hypothetical protein
MIGCGRYSRTAAALPNIILGNADDGRWDFPIGTVMIKIFMFDGKLVETRLLMHTSTMNNWNQGRRRAGREACLTSAFELGRSRDAQRSSLGALGARGARAPGPATA